MGVDVSGSTFVVTGGLGFIGTHVVRQLLDGGAREVRIVDVSAVANPYSDDRRVKICVADINDLDALRSALGGADGVFHMAVLPLNACTQNPRLCLEVNVLGTLNVARAALDVGVRRLVFSSASSVYGDTLEIMDEAHPLNARTMYGVSKIGAEHVLRAMHTTDQLDYVTLRYMNVYGPGQRDGLIANTVRRILANERPVIFGEGSQSFDFVYVADVARANLLAMQSDVRDTAMNIGSGTEITVRDLVHELLRLAQSDLEPEFRSDVNVPMQRRVGTSARAAQLLNFAPSVALRDGLAMVIDAARSSQTTTG